jgi:CheY-like chemotaxis protein
MKPSRPAALIVDDQPFVGMVASDILRESGFETFHAYDAADAAQMLAEHPEIEVVVTEAQLPGEMTGIELCRRLSEQRPNLRLVVTAASPELHSATVPNGARMLRKPYASGELRTVAGDGQLLADA